jgi:hypothetical protein
MEMAPAMELLLPGLSTVAPVIQLVLCEFPAERVAVNSEKMRGARLISVNAVQHPLDETFFEFSYGFVKQDAAFHHLTNQSFQLILHVFTLQKLRLLPGPKLQITIPKPISRARVL